MPRCAPIARAPRPPPPTPPPPRPPPPPSSACAADVANDAPVLPSAALLLSTPEDTKLTITNTELLAGATDVDSSALTVVIVTQPTTGTLTLVSGNYDFQPALDSNATVTFTYQVNDGGANSNVRAVIISISERRARACMCVCVCMPGRAHILF